MTIENQDPKAFAEGYFTPITERSTKGSALSLITKEAEDRRLKTERLRAMRLEAEQARLNGVQTAV